MLARSAFKSETTIRLSLGVVITFGAMLGIAHAQETPSWTPIPNCGPTPPVQSDITDNTPLWQCSKTELYKSQIAYESGLHAFWSELSEAEREVLKSIIGRWRNDDATACTQMGSTDMGCLIASQYKRAEILREAAENCTSGSCQANDLP
jgi:hypothetical protein